MSFTGGADAATNAGRFVKILSPDWIHFCFFI
jgi:hypothetical protein